MATSYACLPLAPAHIFDTLRLPWFIVKWEKILARYLLRDKLHFISDKTDLLDTCSYQSNSQDSGKLNNYSTNNLVMYFVPKGVGNK